VAANRIELSGRLAADPELRTTPAGTPILRIVVDCGEPPEHLTLGCVMVGEAGREAAERLRRGSEVRVAGRLRALSGPQGSGRVEVIASGIETVDTE
jgi:single-stranded DNA-binding protein